MKKILFVLTMPIVVLGLVSCTCGKRGYVKNASEVVGTADWAATQTITVELKEHSFTPSGLDFVAGKTYKLEIKNTGTEKHYFTAEEFYRAIATRKVQSNVDGEIKAGYLTAIEVYPGRSLDLYFVPVAEGTYPLKCTMAGHAEKGMTGTIRILPSPEKEKAKAAEPAPALYRY